MKIIYAGLLFLLHLNSVFAQEKWAFVTNAATPSSITACEVNPISGQFEQCHQAYLDFLSTPLDIAFATFQHESYAYISNSNYPATVTRCLVNWRGELYSCLPTDVNTYAGITFHQTDALYAYLSQTMSVTKCKVDAQGFMQQQDCVDSGAGSIFLNGPIYLTFKRFNNTVYAYIADGDYQVNARVMQCMVQDNGDFVACQPAVNHAFDGAADIDFATLFGQTYAYVTESGGFVTKCLVNTDTGLFLRCARTGGQFNTPLGMAMQTVGDKQYAYIVDGGFNGAVANTVSQCEVKVDGDLNCKDSGQAAAFANPFGLNFYAI